MEQREFTAGRRFFFGFVLTLLVMIPMGLTIWRWRSTRADIHQTDEASGAVKIAIAEPYNLLLGCTDSSESLCGCLLLRLDPDEGRMIAAVIPTDSIVVYKKALMPADELTALCGFRTTAAGISETLGVPVDYALCLEADALTELIDSLGGYPLALTHDLIGVGENGLIEFRLFAGKTQVFGAETVYILQHRLSDADGDPMLLQRRMTESMLSAFCEIGFGDDPAALLTELLDSSDTNLSISAVAPILRSLSSVCESDGALTAFVFSGENSPEGFLLDSEAVASAARFFGGTP